MCAPSSARWGLLRATQCPCQRLGIAGSGSPAGAAARGSAMPTLIPHRRREMRSGLQESMGEGLAWEV